MTDQLSNFQKVKEFSVAMRLGDQISETPSWPGQPIEELRVQLIKEEFDEYVEAIWTLGLPEIAKELADLLYVVYGTGLAYGFDMDACFAAVHASNMSKLDENGNPIYREDGKVLKGPNYFPPDMEGVIKQCAQYQT